MLELLSGESSSTGADPVVELHMLGSLLQLAVNIDVVVAYLDEVAGESHTALHIVVTTIHGTVDNLAKDLGLSL